MTIVPDRIPICSFPLRASFGFRDSDFGFGLRAKPALERESMAAA
jgi:hypothetical protein